MSINENKEFEAINKKSHDTEAAYRAKKAKATKRAIAFIAVTLLALGATIVGITALEAIGWINATFRIVLMCVVGSMAMFKVGYFWHEIKN